jgi:endo-1,3-1,4-beta-glycanase ExoK
MAAGPSFFDGFDKLDTSRWYISDGWSNGKYMNCAWAKDQIKVAGGMLSVSFTKAPGAQGRAYRCGELHTKGTYSFGTYEARLKTPPMASGVNAAFFTYTGPPNNQVHDEIDFEVLLKDPGKVQVATYVNGKSPDASLVDIPSGQSPDFVDFAVVWTADSVNYYVDRKLAFTMSAPTPIPREEQSIFFSLWGSETFTEWMGPFVEPPGPLIMTVDWVAYTAPGETCLFPESVTC